MRNGLRKIKNRKGESMFKRSKRLVAFFLALSMTLSIIPMNVFGRVGTVTPVLHEGGVTWFDAHIPVHYLAGREIIRIDDTPGGWLTNLLLDIELVSDYDGALEWGLELGTGPSVVNWAPGIFPSPGPTPLPAPNAHWAGWSSGNAGWNISTAIRHQFDSWNEVIWVEGISIPTPAAVTVPGIRLPYNPNWNILNPTNSAMAGAMRQPTRIVSGIIPVPHYNTFEATFAPTGARTGVVALDYWGMNEIGEPFLTGIRRIPTRFLDPNHAFGPRLGGPFDNIHDVHLGDTILSGNTTGLVLRFGIRAEAPNARLQVRLDGRLIFNAPITGNFAPDITLRRRVSPDYNRANPHNVAVYLGEDARAFHTHLVLPPIHFEELRRGDLRNEPGAGPGEWVTHYSWVQYVTLPTVPGRNFPTYAVGNPLEERNNFIPIYNPATSRVHTVAGGSLMSTSTRAPQFTFTHATFRDFISRFRADTPTFPVAAPVFAFGNPADPYIPIFVEAYRHWAMLGLRVPVGTRMPGVAGVAGGDDVDGTFWYVTAGDFALASQVQDPLTIGGGQNLAQPAYINRMLRTLLALTPMQRRQLPVFNIHIPGIYDWTDNIPLFYDLRVLGDTTAIPDGIFTVRLRAPEHYRWSTIVNETLHLPGFYARGLRGTFGGGGTGLPINHLPTEASFIYRYGGREYLYMVIDVGARNYTTAAIARVTDVLTLRNIVLIPTEAAAAEQDDLTVRVQWGWSDGPVRRADNTYGRPVIRYIDGRGGIYPYRTQDLVVGHRSVGAVSLSVESAVDLRSGLYNVYAHYNNQGRGDVRSARITLEETHPGSWDTMLGSALHFTTNRSDVQIIDARYRVHNYNWGGSPYWVTTWGNGGRGANIPGGSNAVMVLNHSGANYHANHHAYAFNRLTLLPAFDPHVTGRARENRRRMEIDIFFSIEADNANRDYSDAIQIVVDGRAVAAMPLASRTLTVANIYDPITVEIVGGPITVPVPADVHSLFAPGFNNIRVTETRAGILEVGSELLFYVTGTELSPFTVHFVTNAVATVNAASGMTLSPARARVFNVGGQQIHGVYFEVLRASSGTPAEIILTNNSIQAPIFPGGEGLQLVVGGRGIAENNHFEWWDTVSLADRVGRSAFRPDRGIFISNPYARDVIRFGPSVVLPDEVTPTPTPTPTPGVTPPSRGATVFSLDMPPSVSAIAGHVIQQPFMLMPPDFVSSVVSLRYFAENVLGVEPVVSGMHVTITALDAVGVSVTVNLEFGSPIATITRAGSAPITTDIATFVTAGGAGVWPTGSIITYLHQGNRSYLPLRFMVYAFGANIGPSAGNDWTRPIVTWP
jgi:hypothetical protein